jgi:hypothetical protein
MTDRIDELVGRASSAQLSRLFALLDTRPAAEASGRDDDILLRLRDPAIVTALLEPVVPNTCGTAAEMVALALDPAPSLPTLQSTFEHARDLVTHASDVETRAAAELLYHAVGAAALARHGVALGHRPAAERRALYARLARQLAGGPFGPLFAAAVAGGEPAGSSNPPPAA